jgi:hypothetical protein
MSERVKTILLILFVVGVIGAFNSIIRLSQANNESPLQSILQTLGLSKKAAPEQGRKLDYVPGEIQKGGQPVTNTQNSQQPDTNKTVTVSPTPATTSNTNSLQTSPELPPLPPINNVKGVKTAKLPPLPPLTSSGKTLGVSSAPKNLPPLPPVNKQSKTLGAKTENSFDNQLKDILNYFGF